MYRLPSLLFLCYGLVTSASTDEPPSAQTYDCNNLQYQENLQLKRITGEWHVVEILTHQTNSRYFRGEQLDVTTCPLVTLTLLDNNTELRLHWKEDIGDFNYWFKISPFLPGLWTVIGRQNVSLNSVGGLDRPTYEQFLGTVHVRKAVNDHMVLTWCSPGSQFYSAVMSRNETLDARELTSIANHMQKQKIPITQTKRTCRNGSSTASRAARWLLTAAFCVAHAYWYAAKIM